MARLTKAELLALYPDNSEGLITPERLRDFVDTMDVPWGSLHVPSWWLWLGNPDAFPVKIDLSQFGDGWLNTNGSFGITGGDTETDGDLTYLGDKDLWALVTFRAQFYLSDKPHPDRY